LQPGLAPLQLPPAFLPAPNHAISVVAAVTSASRCHTNSRRANGNCGRLALRETPRSREQERQSPTGRPLTVLTTFNGTNGDDPSEASVTSPGCPPAGWFVRAEIQGGELIVEHLTGLSAQGKMRRRMLGHHPGLNGKGDRLLEQSGRLPIAIH
jgi:hypothetical protein